jgi:hypothetical protein
MFLMQQPVIGRFGLQGKKLHYGPLLSHFGKISDAVEAKAVK